MMNFWQFVYERMSIYNKRRAGVPKPWTKDKTLQTAFFTNVFRELDPGTRIAEAIMSRNAPKWIRAWNILLYRRLNREYTWAWIAPNMFFKNPARQVKTLEKKLRVLAANGPIFTGAHEVSMMQAHTELGDDYIERQANAMKQFNKVKQWTKIIATRSTAKEAFKATVDFGLPGVGKFLAWQLVLDLRYGSDPIGRYSDDEWAPVQMGAKNGLIAVFNDANEDLLSGMVYAQDLEFKKYGLRFKDVSRKKLTFAAMEHSLCEYAKYVRITKGGHAKGKFKGAL